MRISAYKISFVWALLLAVLSFLPGKHFPVTHISGLDLVVHFTFYCVLTLLIIIGTTQSTKNNSLTKHPVLLAILISVAYGAFIELIQGTVFVYRSAEVSDFIANTIGSLFGYLLYVVIYKPIKNRLSWKEKKPPVKITENNPPNISS